MSKLLLSCKAANALMEKKHRQEISLTERIQLPLHLALCAACRQYQKQSALLERLFEAEIKMPVDSEIIEQSTQLEEKILRQLDGKG